MKTGNGKRPVSVSYRAMARRRMFVGDRRCFWRRTMAIREFNTVETTMVKGAQKR